MSKTVFDCLNDVSKFCTMYSELCNAHTVDFIVKNRWSILPLELQTELLSLNAEQLAMLLQSDTSEIIDKSNYAHLCHFIKEAKSHTIETMLPLLPQSPYAVNITEEKPALVPINILMSPKKSHEVGAMTSVIASLVDQHNIDTVVDFGTGKGYLSSHLALNHSLNVLGIDSSEGNCQAADKRNMKLISRFITKNPKAQEYECSSTEKCEVTLLETSGGNSNAKPECSVCPSSGVFVGNALTIKDSTDFSELIQSFLVSLKTQNNPIENRECTGESRILFTGLHACGNLMPCMLKKFVSTKEAKVLCSVGCCYQHVREQFIEDPFYSKDITSVNDYGFPLSQILLKSQCSLGRNARMLASQSLSRILKSNTLEIEPLFYRAVLQVILKDHVKSIDSDFRVGKLAPKCSSFKIYVEKALQRLGLSSVTLSAQELNAYLARYAEEKKKLHAFQFLRVLLAPCLETLMLLDRLVFLTEKAEIKEAYVSRLFDPVISPRCYALVAVKS